MQDFKRLATAFFLSLISIGFQTAAQASESAWALPADSRYFELQMGGGLYQQEGQDFTQFTALNRYEYGLLDHTTFELAWPALIRSRRVTELNNALAINNGFTDLYVGLRSQLFQDLLPEALALSLHLASEIPTGYALERAPVIGERQLNLYGGFLAGYHFAPLEAYVQTGGGYRWRSDYDPQHIRVVQAELEGRELTKPADQLVFFAESGAWLTQRLFASLNLTARLALGQENSLEQSFVQIQPLLAWRVTPYFDVSTQFQQVLWQENWPPLSQFLVGGHFRFGLPLSRAVGLRGGRIDYAEFDDQL